MNQSHQTLGCICRWGLGHISNAAPRCRTFSCTSSYWKGKHSFYFFHYELTRLAVPSFAPSSTPELDSLLNDFREKIFIPDSLSKQHQRLVYRPTKHHVLTNEPGVTVTIGEDEEVKLVPLDFDQRPDKGDGFIMIRSLLNNNDDDVSWQNTFPLMEGLQASRSDQVTIPSSFRQQLAVLAVKQGKSRYIIRLFDQPKKTGFTLRNPGLTRAFLLACHGRAAAVEFKGDEFDNIARDVAHVAGLMETGDHCGGLGIMHHLDASTPEFDSRRSLLTIGLLLEIAAARALNGEDAHDQVSNYFTKALALSEHGIEDGSTLHIWRDPSRSETDHINYEERPELEVLLNAFNMTAKVEGSVADNQRSLLNSRLTTIAERLDDINERDRQLYEIREQKRAKEPSQ